MPTIEMTQKCETVAKIMKILSHPSRLKIICFLSERDHTVSELEEAVGISQSAMSQYLTQMWTQGILSREKNGASVTYAISDPKLKKLVRQLNTLFCKGDSL